MHITPNLVIANVLVELESHVHNDIVAKPNMNEAIEEVGN